MFVLPDNNFCPKIPIITGIKQLRKVSTDSARIIAFEETKKGGHDQENPIERFNTFPKAHIY